MYSDIGFYNIFLQNTLYTYTYSKKTSSNTYSLLMFALYTETKSYISYAYIYAAYSTKVLLNVFIRKKSTFFE